MKKICFLSIGIILILSGILIGSPIKYNAIVVNAVTCIIGIGYVVYKIRKKENIVQNKLDIGVILLCFVSFIPIITQKYVSLQDSILYTIKYVTICLAYFLVKEVCMENKKYLSYINAIFIMLAVVLCVFGIDNMTTNFFTKYLDKLDCVFVINVENRMFSTLGYANSFAIILAVSILLAIGSYLKTESKKVKKILAIGIFLFVSCMFLTYSKSTLILLAICMIAYMILLKNKEKRVKSMYLLGVEIIVALIYITIWNKLVGVKAYELLWGITFVFCIIVAVLEEIIEKLENKIQKIKIQTYYKMGIACSIFIVVFITVGLNLTAPLTIFQNKDSQTQVKYKISKINPNTFYSLKFKIEAISEFENKENYMIRIEEENKYYDTVKVHEISFNSYKGEKKIELETSPETIELAVYFKSTYAPAQKGVTIEKFTVNGEEYVLNYAYLPVSLVHRIQDIGLSNKSVWERGTFYIDAMKIIKENWLLGIGGNGWEHSYKEVQSYTYGTTQVHSYFLQIWIEYGILGIGIFISILYQMIKIIGKQREKTTILTVGIALILLLTHSFFDFDMSFMYIMLLAFSMLGMLSATKKEEIKYSHWFSYSILLISIIGTLLCINEIVLVHIWPYKTEEVRKEIEKEIRQKNDNEAIEKIKNLEKYEKKVDVFSELDSISYERIKTENLDYIYTYMEKQKIKVNPYENKQKNSIIEKILNSSIAKEEKEKFAKMVIRENESIIEAIKNKEKNRVSEENMQKLLKEQERIENLATKMLEEIENGR